MHSSVLGYDKAQSLIKPLRTVRFADVQTQHPPGRGSLVYESPHEPRTDATIAIVRHQRDVHQYNIGAAAIHQHSADPLLAHADDVVVSVGKLSLITHALSVVLHDEKRFGLPTVPTPRADLLGASARVESAQEIFISGLCGSQRHFRHSCILLHTDHVTYDVIHTSPAKMSFSLTLKLIYTTLNPYMSTLKPSSATLKASRQTLKVSSATLKVSSATLNASDATLNPPM